MTRNEIQVTDAELAVLGALWDHGPATIREITARLYKQQSIAEYATVQKLLDRLEAKRCVSRERSQPAHVFSAKIDRGRLIGDQLKQTADKLCQGSMTPLLMQLAESTRLTARDRAILRKLLSDN